MVGHTHEPHIPCPKCGHQIPLTASIAAPLLEAERRSFETKLAARDAEFARKADETRKQQDDIAEARANVEELIKQRLDTEREQVAAAEAKKARDAVASDLQAQASEVAELQRTLKGNNVKLAEAQQAQAELIRKQRALDEQKRELDLTIEKRVQASVEIIQTKARQEADEAARLRVAEKDQTIESMARTIEELKRKAEQGSQQSQGEVLELELELEELLRGRFPTDSIDPIGKGELGADVMQQVNGAIGQPVGIILQEPGEQRKQEKNPEHHRPDSHGFALAVDGAAVADPTIWPR